MEYRNTISLPVSTIDMDLKKATVPFEGWRHTIGHGGVNSLPLPEKVIEGAKSLKPRLLRTFIQEYFNIYPEHGRFDWTKLDPYMDALKQTGADVVACICIKPPVLYPIIDQTIWEPNDWEEWQQVIYQLVKRYSVDNPIVTYWEIGNETDIGEHGACPYLITETKDYMMYYNLTIKAILDAFPASKVGGPAIAGFDHKLLFEFIDSCHEQNIQLDFVSWHLYSDDPRKHQNLVNRMRKHLEKFGDQQPEMLVTEWSGGFGPEFIEEYSQLPRRAALTAASISAMLEAKLDWSFYYHVWDQTFYPNEFMTFYKEMSIMIEHWNEMPHRFGLMGVGGEIRPQYYVYKMLSQMGDEQLEVNCKDEDLWIDAAVMDNKITIMITNYNHQGSTEKVAKVFLKNLSAGIKQLEVFRIDDSSMWSKDKFEFLPCESRIIDSIDNYTFRQNIYCPADSVTFIVLNNVSI